MQQYNLDRARLNIEPRYRTLITIWGAMLGSLMMYAALTVFIQRPLTAENKTLQFALGAVSGVLAVLSFILKRKLLVQAAERQQVALVQTAYIIAYAMGEAAGMCGLVLYFLTPGLSFYLPFALSLLVMLAHYPRRDHLLAIEAKRQV